MECQCECSMSRTVSEISTWINNSFNNLVKRKHSIFSARKPCPSVSNKVSLNNHSAQTSTQRPIASLQTRSNDAVRELLNTSVAILDLDLFNVASNIGAEHARDRIVQRRQH